MDNNLLEGTIVKDIVDNNDNNSKKDRKKALLCIGASILLGALAYNKVVKPRLKPRYTTSEVEVEIEEYDEL